MSQEEHKLIENYCVREAEFRRAAAIVVQRHSPLLNNHQAYEVARICLKSWQDMREMFSWSEAPEFIERL